MLPNLRESGAIELDADVVIDLLELKYLTTDLMLERLGSTSSSSKTYFSLHT